MIRPGQTVAIPAGSRGIANIGLILREIAAYFSSIGAALPFIVPAMGSHGGGTVEGQVRMLQQSWQLPKNPSVFRFEPPWKQ